MAALSSSVAAKPLSLYVSPPPSIRRTPGKFSRFLASFSPSSSSSSSAAFDESQSDSKTEKPGVSSKGSSPKGHFVDPLRSQELPYNYALGNPSGSSLVRFLQSTEYNIEKVIFDFRFLALLAIGGSLAGSLLCFLNGCVYIFDAYKVYWTSCVNGIHSGQMVLRLVEAIDVYLAGTVMLIFGMGLYGLFISNVPPNLPPAIDRALKGSSLFGEAEVDENQFSRRTEDEIRTCYSDDPPGQDVRKEQNGDNNYWGRLAELLCMYILVFGFFIHSS